MKRIDLVRGVGINDTGQAVTKYKFWYDRGKRRQRIVWRCPAYTVWNNMLARCYDERVTNNHPSYSDVKVDERWHLFSNFKQWWFDNYVDGWHLDKDILSDDNGKVYGPDTCCFIPKVLNNFLTNTKGAKGYTERSSGRFQVFCSDPISGKVTSHGTFDTEEEAALTYHFVKHSRLLQLLVMYPSIDTRVADKFKSIFLTAKELQ